jgi:hypothetical protein
MPAASDIREHMAVIGSDGAHLGTVDHLASDGRIKLTKSDSSDGAHHLIGADLVDHVDEHVHLNVTADEAMEQWEEVDEDDEDEDEIDLEDDSSAGRSAADVDEDEEEAAR